MKRTFNYVPSALLILAIVAVTIAPGMAQAKKNLISGTDTVTGAVASWAGFSAINLIPGTALFPVSSPKTVLYLGFTAGSTADVGRMVLYKTLRNSPTITQVVDVFYRGLPSPAIGLSNKFVCPTQPISVAHPCFLRLDPVTLSLSPLNDYYFVVFFPQDTNNQAVNAATSLFSRSSIIGGFDAQDDTQLKVGDSIPAGILKGQSMFLLGAMTN